MQYRLLPSAVVAVLLLAVPAQAQANERGGRTMPAPTRTLSGPNISQSRVAASYQTYGVGCQGTGRVGFACEFLNPLGGTLSNPAHNPANEYAYGVQITQPTTILGFRLFTAVNGATSTVAMTCSLYMAATTTPTMPSSATSTVCGTMVVGTAPAFYDVYFNTPTVVPANTNVWISQHDSGSILVSDLTAGNSPPLPTYWRRPAGSTAAWAVTGIVQFPSWQLICDGGPNTATPLLTNKDQPVLGSSYDILLAHAASGGVPAFLFFGASRSTWAGIPLPFDLSFLGATGCNVNASGEIVIPTTTSVHGTAAITVTVPNVQALDGVTLYNQWIIFDLTANPFGLVFSNGGAGTFGT